jgi:hypothetical protein
MIQRDGQCPEVAIASRVAESFVSGDAAKRALYYQLEVLVEVFRERLDALRLEHINPEHVQQMGSVDHVDEMQGFA